MHLGVAGVWLELQTPANKIAVCSCGYSKKYIACKRSYAVFYLSLVMHLTRYETLLPCQLLDNLLFYVRTAQNMLETEGQKLFKNNFYLMLLLYSLFSHISTCNQQLPSEFSFIFYICHVARTRSLKTSLFNRKTTVLAAKQNNLYFCIAEARNSHLRSSKTLQNPPSVLLSHTKSIRDRTIGSQCVVSVSRAKKNQCTFLLRIISRELFSQVTSGAALTSGVTHVQL